MTERPGGCGALKARAFTLASASGTPQVYAALSNRGDRPVCSAAFSVELFDASGTSIGAAVGGLLMNRFYRVVDPADATAACVAPGEESLLALRDLGSDVELDRVARVEYWCNYWLLDVVPLGALTVSSVRVEGGAYAGVLANGLDEPIPAPGVAVFPTDSAGRLLGVTLAEGSTALPPHEDWEFVTTPIATLSDSFTAFPTRGP